MNFDLRIPFRVLYNYLDQQSPHFTTDTLTGLSPFINKPREGTKYALGEMRLGLISIFLTNCLIYFLLKYRSARFFETSTVSASLFYWLFQMNCLGLVPKLITYVHLASLNLDQNVDVLRTKLLLIFGKRVYGYATRCGGISIISNFLSMIVSLKYFLRRVEDRWEDVDFWLLVYTIGFHLRFAYSYYRFSKYFSDVRNSLNRFQFQEFTYGEDKCKESLAKRPNSTDSEMCSICWAEYKEGDRIALFTCEAGHAFHLECLYKWLRTNSTCPLCRSHIYDHLMKDRSL